MTLFSRSLVRRIHILASFLIVTSYGFAGSKVIPPAVGVYHAAFPYFGPLEDRVSISVVSRFKVLAKKPIAWAYSSNNWFRGIKFPVLAVRAIYRAGAVPFIRLMPRTGFHLPDTMYSLQKIIEGKFDPELSQWALGARKLGIPLMLEFAGEPNGDWFPWSGSENGGGETTGYGDPSLPDGPERYRDAYRHIIDLFRAEGADKITWVLHLNSGSSPVASWNRMAAYYPGDDYIDWIGESAYGAQIHGEAWELLTDVLDRSYPELSHISATKPLALLEYGVIDDGVPGHKAAWIREGLDSIKSGRYPGIKGVSYWHSKFRNADGSISNMRLDSSPDVRLAYQAEVLDPFFVSTPQFDQPVLQVAGLDDPLPTEFVLDQNYPNPFNPFTTIQFSLPSVAFVSLKVYNSLGQEVATLIHDELMDEGMQDVEFDGGKFSSGVYFYQLIAEIIADDEGTPGERFTSMKKMILMK